MTTRYEPSEYPQHCPRCRSSQSRIARTVRRPIEQQVRRYRTCADCGRRWASNAPARNSFHNMEKPMS